MKKLFAEFKEFALRGNVMDLAVGVIIGGAFQSIVTALTDNLITPLLSLIGGTGEVKGLAITFSNGSVIDFGAFISAVIHFLIMALVLFAIIKAMNTITSIGKHEEPAEPTTKKCPYCQSEIDIAATKCPHCTSDIPAE